MISLPIARIAAARDAAARADWRPLVLRFAPVALAVLGFTVTLAFTSRHEPVVPPAIQLAAPQEHPASLPMLPEQPPAQRPAEAVIPQPVHAPMRVAEIQSAATTPAGESAGGGQLPVVAEVREDTEVPIDLRARSHDGQSGAAVFNRSGEPLHLAITASNPATGRSSRVDLTLDAHESKELTEAGLAFEPGDQVRVQSPPYRDLILNR